MKTTKRVYLLGILAIAFVATGLFVSSFAFASTQSIAHDDNPIFNGLDFVTSDNTAQSPQNAQANSVETPVELTNWQYTGDSDVGSQFNGKSRR